jgi:hypothetical protein
MSENDKSKGRPDVPEAEDAPAPELQHRRQFLIGLGKWSQAVIAGATFGAAALGAGRDAGAWLNSRGGGGWINGNGGWINGGATWINGGGSWINNGGWVNNAGNWVNRAGGGGWINGFGRGGAGWVNRRGGGGWVNRRRGGGWWNA